MLERYTPLFLEARGNKKFQQFYQDLTGHKVDHNAEHLLIDDFKKDIHHNKSDIDKYLSDDKYKALENVKDFNELYDLLQNWDTSDVNKLQLKINLNDKSSDLLKAWSMALVGKFRGNKKSMEQ